MIDVEVYPVMRRSPGRVLNWLGFRSMTLGLRWPWLGRLAVAAVRALWRVENPQMRWQAEWPGCQHAPRALTRRGVMRKALHRRLAALEEARRG